jgi:hypothetical protein
LSGFPTIDGVTFPSGTNRVLLVGQTNPVENGLWVVAAGAWTRPADFATGTAAGEAYVLILQGTVNAGSSWLCNTPTAIIDTDPIFFAEFSLPSQTTGANVGAGTGLVFRDKTGVTLNFRSLLADTHMVITTNADDITIGTDATNVNTASTIVARDASGDFSAGTITANLNGNATTATTATNFSGSLAGDVTGTQGATVVSFVGGQSAANVAAATVLANGATSVNTPNTIVKRGATGNFSAGAISVTDEVISSSLTVIPFNTAGVVHNNASGLLSSSLIVNADVDPAAAIADTKLATISTAGKVANSATTATSANTPNTIVLRDGSGDFSASTITASLTGAASLNVLKSGDSMTGTLNMLTQNEVRFQDAAGGQYVGINAQSVIPTSYTLSLPTTIPTAHQIMRANGTTPTNLEWFTQGGSVVPANSEMIYVTKYGNDVTGDGSLDAPYASLAQAISVANALASAFNPVCILISAGIYIEDNSAGPLAITAQGISTVGYSPDTTIIIPSTLSNDLLLATQSTQISNIRFFASGISTATGVSLAAGTFSTFNNIQAFNFNIGVLCAGGSSSTYVFSNGLFVGNATGISINDTAVELNNCSIVGSASLVTPANTGISTTGANATCIINGGTLALCTTGLLLQNNSNTTANAINFKLNTFDIIQTSAAQSTISSCSFEVTTGSSDIDVQVSGAGTLATIVGCEFNGNSSLGVPQATSMFVTDNGSIQISGGQLKNYTTGIHVGLPSDTSSTMLTASSFTIINCTTDILQEGSSTLNFNAGVATGSKIIINDATNLNFAFFDLNDDNALTIGLGANVDTSLIQVATLAATQPGINYLSSLYGTEAIGFINENSSPSTWFATSDQNTITAAITSDRTKISGLQLVSDTALPIGSTTALRGWDINKNASTAELSFSYQNSDAIGQAIIPQYTLMQLDGVNNQLQLPTVGTHIIFDGDTNLYRSAANVLKTDDNFIVGTLTPGRVVVTDLVTNQLASSIVTTTELSFLSGVTSPIQTQLNNKVSRSGDTMTGTLQLPAGTTALPSLVFTGSTTTGLSASAGDLSFSTNALERMKISSSGTVSIDAFTVSGVVHNDASGNLSSSLIVNADVDPAAAIVDTKLATISTAGKVANSATTATSVNTPNTIVLRDGSGNFSAGTITANLNGNATTATTSTNFSGSLSGDVTGTQGATVVSSVGGQSAANVAAATVLANGATSANVANTIVKRGATGNFSAGAVSVTDEVITGILQPSAGTAAVPSIQFTGSTNTGFSAATANTLSFDTNGVERMSISTTAITTAANFINGKQFANQSIESFTITANNQSFAVASTTSILILSTAANRTGFTVTFPASPINGQYFSIISTSINSIGLINNGNGATVVSGVVTLDANANFSATAGGASVTYFYYLPNNSWYKYSRG